MINPTKQLLQRLQLPLLFVLSIGVPTSYAYDVANGRKINSSCALCHGFYGQGTPGSLSPRLAGLPAKYIIKELEFYRDGTRTYPPMVVASQIKNMTDKDITDVSEYLASINLEKMDLPEIPIAKGDPKKGEELFKEDCKTCHGKEAEGKPKKGAPMLAGQYASYILNQIRRFKIKERHHDDDPDDETFDDYSQVEIESIAAHLTHLTKQKQTERRERVAALMGMAGMEGGMAGMQQGMAGMLAMAGMTSKTLTCATDLCKETTDGTGDGFAGTFKVSSRGEIILSPSQRDLRMVAGLHGRFKISTTGGLEFHPDTEILKKTEKK